MAGRKGVRGAALLAVMAVLAAGCGPRFPRTAGQVTAGQQTATTVAAGGSTDAGATNAGATTDSTLAGAVTTLVSGATGVVTGPGTATTVAAAGAVDPGPAPGVTATSIKIGYLLPLTGAAPVPSNFDKGARVYWNYINAKGGILGRQVQIVIKDTQSSGPVGKNQAQALIEQDKVFAIVVLDRLENQQQIGEYLDSRKFPNVEIQTPANLNKSQTWTFGVTVDHGVQGRLIADYFVRSLGIKNAAVVYENTPTLEPGVQAFKNEMTKLGGQVSYTTKINGQDNDFSQQSLAMSRSGAKAAWLYMAPTPAAKLANQADATGYHPVWFANSISWGFDLVFTVAPTALRGARAFSPWLPLSDPRTATYKAAYSSQTGEQPDDLGIVGWGVGEIVGAGLSSAGKQLGQNGFRNAMQNLKFRPDIWAPLSFGPGVREGADVVAVLKQEGSHWALDHDFTSSF